MSGWPRVLPVGDRALTLELGAGIDPVVNARVRALDRALGERPLAGVLESVPSYRSLLVVYDPRLATFAGLRAELLERLPASLPAGEAAGGRHVVPTVYDGPDLDDVARATGLDRDDVIELHAGGEYTAFMLGFAPGFAYLGLLDERLATKRLATPRLRVPQGAVAVAGRQTGLYPGGTAGGWSLIGRTGFHAFDATRSPPALILPGDRVRFEPVAALPEQTPERAQRARDEAPRIEVVRGGLLTSVQDRGRPGQRRHGVAGCGAADVAALDAANAALGNGGDAAGLECTIDGPSLRFLAPVRFAIAGADLGAVLERSDLGEWPVPLETPVQARAGNLLSFRGRRAGCRAYLAFAGGLAVPEVLGSRSTDLTGGFGGFLGRALSAGDRLGLLPARGSAGVAPERGSAGASPSASITLRVVLGPQDDHFDAATLARFLADEFAVLASSDRVACRLSGPALAASGSEIVSDGMLPGCVQVPPDGQPIVMLADSPTTGGYPKLATVVAADLPLLAQLVPGEGRVRFARA